MNADNMRKIAASQTPNSLRVLRTLYPALLIRKAIATQNITKNGVLSCIKKP